MEKPAVSFCLIFWFSSTLHLRLQIEHFTADGYLSLAALLLYAQSTHNNNDTPHPRQL